MVRRHAGLDFKPFPYSFQVIKNLGNRALGDPDLDAPLRYTFGLCIVKRPLHGMVSDII